ncbi:MAG: hypothetical protein IKT39_04985 [Clostridia bacterium]|nr:hypothetical protein [Clostridia bacterium]
MSDRNIPNIFRLLLSDMCIDKSNITGTSDGFFVVNKSIANILSVKDIFDFPDTSGERLACGKFFDDWFLYAVPNDNDYAYSLLKLREQEHDTEDGSPADGDTPGVTISFVSFDSERLLDCLSDPSDEKRRKLNTEINRVVAYRGQRHHKALKKYFRNPLSEGAYLVADTYIKTIASYAESGVLGVPEFYKEIVQQSISYKTSAKLARLPRFIEALNKAAGRVICDNKKIHIENRESLTDHEQLAILATHTGNTSFYSFAAEVEYHARFLTPLAKIKIPFFGRSIYDSAIRADMTVGDTEFEGPAPFYKETSKIVKRQYALHRMLRF